jgi:hypothetical protein
VHTGGFRSGGRIGWVVTLGVSVCAIAALAGPAVALGYGGGIDPAITCAIATHAAEVGMSGLPLEPASGATVPAGTPVTFAGESMHALTFDVASSPALLSSPDIDSGLGSQSGSFYKFISTKATATPRTIYWTASLTFIPEGCENPSTFTTPVSTLIVAPSEAELAAKKQQEEVATRKQQEEQATKMRAEEEAAAKKKDAETAASGSVVLDGVTIDVENSREAAVKLTCRDVETCAGKLTLTASTTARKGKARRTKAESVGTVSYSIPAGKNATIEITLDRIGRELLGDAHGHLSATLAILRTSPPPDKTQVEHVGLNVKARYRG